MENSQKPSARLDAPRPNRGIVLITLAALCWSLGAPLVKSLPLDPFLLTGLRSLIAGLCLAPLFRPRRIHWDGNALMMAISYTVHCTLIVLALRTTSAPIAVAMQFTAPIWLFFWERKKGDPLLIRRLWPLCVMMLGMGLFMCSKGTGVTTLGNIVAACSSLSFAALTFFSKRVSERSNNPLGMTAVSNLATAAVMLAFFIKQPVAQLAAITAAQWPVVLLLSVVQTGGGYGFYFMGLRDVDASTAAMISPLEMVLGPLWVTLFLREYPDLIGLVAFVFVIAGVLGEVMVTRREAEKAA